MTMQTVERKDLEVLWTVNQTAKYFSVIPNTVRRWIREGKIDARKIGTRVRIPRSEINKLVNETRELLNKPLE